MACSDERRRAMEELEAMFSADWEPSDDDGEVREVASISGTIARDSPDQWLWCMYCHRFFQARHLRLDFLGNVQGCAFCRCAGLNVAVHLWDTWRNSKEPWPESTDELRFGLRLKIDTIVRWFESGRADVSCAIMLDPQDRYCLCVQVGANPMIRIRLSRNECRVLRRRNFARLGRFAQNVCADPERFRQRWLEAG